MTEKLNIINELNFSTNETIEGYMQRTVNTNLISGCTLLFLRACMSRTILVLPELSWIEKKLSIHMGLMPIDG